MRIIINEPWNYQLIKNNYEYFLSIMCGSVGLYEVEIKLTREEISEYEQNGKTSIEKLVSSIRENPEKYRSRKKE